MPGIPVAPVAPCGPMIVTPSLPLVPFSPLTTTLSKLVRSLSRENATDALPPTFSCLTVKFLPAFIVTVLPSAIF